MWPKLRPWLSKYPDIKIEISSDNRFTDIVAERFDVGVRLGSDVAKDMIAVRMAPDMRLAVVGSAAYFARRPPPLAPQSLVEHDCIGLRLPTHGGMMTWELKRRGKSVNAHVSGRLTFNTSELIVAAALEGHGLAWLPDDLVREHIAAGRLISALDEWAVTYPGYHLYYPSRRASPALALVVSALRYSQG